MSAAARTIRAVKPHIPMIKFPSRIPVKAGSTQSTNTSESLTNPPSINPSPNVVQSRTVLDDESELPFRYLRKPISLEEMQFIERGGPE